MNHLWGGLVNLNIVLPSFLAYLQEIKMLQRDARLDQDLMPTGRLKSRIARYLHLTHVHQFEFKDTTGPTRKKCRKPFEGSQFNCF